MTGGGGIYVIPWSQTEVDGLPGAPVAALEVGASWRWEGPALRMDRPGGPLLLSDPEGEDVLRRRAARVVRRMLGPTLPAQRRHAPDLWEDPALDRHFVVTDGRHAYPVLLVEVAEAARPLLMLPAPLPPSGAELWVVRDLSDRPPPAPVQDRPAGMICFTAGTLLATPNGPRPVEALAEGDRLLTRDDGPQEIRWIGHRRITGARMQAEPGLRPVRIRAGALGGDAPRPDLVVSPRHRLLLKGAVAEALFGTPEVLVAAADLVNDRGIAPDRAARELTYFHVLLPRHHVVWANGVETESFHPAHTALDTIAPGQRARLDAVLPDGPDATAAYGPPARRMLGRGEAAILLHEAGGGPLTPRAAAV